MRFLEVTLERVRCSFQRKHWQRLGRIYLAKTAPNPRMISLIRHLALLLMVFWYANIVDV